MTKACLSAAVRQTSFAAPLSRLTWIADKSVSKIHRIVQTIMPQYIYKAIDKNGSVRDGEFQASNIDELESRLAALDLELIHYKEKRTGGVFHFDLRLAPGLERKDLIVFCYYMEELIRAGVPLVEGLSDLRDTLGSGQMHDIIATLIEDVQGGQRLSEAMARFPKVFDSVFLTLIQVGESSGELDVIFHHIMEGLKWQDELISHTKKLLMYPTIVGIVIIGVVFFMMTYLVPELTSFITSMGQELPLHTRALIATSNFFVNYWYLIIGVPITLFIALMIGKHTCRKVHYFVDWLKLHIPVVGAVQEKIILARFASFFGLMYASGITVLESLKVTRTLANNMVVEEALQNVHDSISDGVSIGESFARANLFPPLVLRMISIGETTGQLDKALGNVSYFYNREVREGIEKLQALITPAMTLIMGGTLGWVMYSVLGPIYDLMETLI
jgi:type IV pilus assembly protein PilC